MLAMYFLLSICHVSEQYLILPAPAKVENEIRQCVLNILDKYFQYKELTIVDINYDDNELLKMIHETYHFSLVTRETRQMIIPNPSYLVLAPDVSTFTDNFEDLTREIFWNPYARFLIVVGSFERQELRLLFNELLRQHVNNVVLMNAVDGNLYTYNSFENYGCGRYYNDVIEFGKCLQTKNIDLYPNKLVTGLKNCTFRASLTHRPPYTLEPYLNEYPNKLPGIEQYVLSIVSQSDDFNFDFKFNFDGWAFTKIEPNMTAIGPMDMLQRNKTDVIFSAMMITTSFAAAFTYVNGYNDYVDEFKFAVQKAQFVPSWKYFYLEFDSLVWFLLLMCIIVYSGIVISLLKPKDKGYIILELFGNLVLQNHQIPSPMIVKYVLIIWVWFAYLVNTFYQSSLVSLTTNPSKEYQILNEQDMVKYNLRPCMAPIFAKNIYTDKSDLKNFFHTKIHDPQCETFLGAMDLVSTKKNIYTILVTYFYLHNEDVFSDKYGEPLIHYIEKPFAKLLCAFHFYKGFPISTKFKLNMMRMRESGLAEKNLKDQYYMRSLKYSYSQREFEYRFVSPWIVYSAGCFLATVCFIVEILWKYLVID